MDLRRRVIFESVTGIFNIIYIYRFLLGDVVLFDEGGVANDQINVAQGPTTPPTLRVTYVDPIVANCCSHGTDSAYYPPGDRINAKSGNWMPRITSL